MRVFGSIFLIVAISPALLADKGGKSIQTQVKAMIKDAKRLEKSGKLVEARITCHKAAVVRNELKRLFVERAHVSGVLAANRVLKDLDLHVQARDGEIAPIGV